MDAQEIIDFIANAPKKTPVKLYVRERDGACLDWGDAHVYGGRDGKVIFGEWADLEPVLLAGADSVEYADVEADRRNSAVPLLDLRGVNARIEPGAIIRDRVEIGDNAVIMMGAVINIGAVIGEGTMIDMGAVLGGRAIVGRNCHVGAGTVLNLEQARRAVDAGARYIVSPGYNMQVVDWCLGHEVPVLPAGVTPTEVTALVNAGVEVTKFFPAAQYGGLATIKALASVFVGHRFMPTGGVSASNLREYLECPAILACGGTWMVKPDLIRAGEFDSMLELTSEAAALVREIRG